MLLAILFVLGFLTGTFYSKTQKRKKIEVYLPDTPEERARKFDIAAQELEEDGVRLKLEGLNGSGDIQFREAHKLRAMAKDLRKNGMEEWEL